MSRNPNKARCQAPGCRNWAMRGHTHCRSHRDAELGPRGAGAPAGNLNALTTGHDAHAFDPSGLHHLAQQIASDPQQLPAHLERAIASVHGRTGDPVKTLIAIQAPLAQLAPLVAENMFIAGLKDLLIRIPPQRRSGLQVTLWKHSLHMSPQTRLRLLRAAIAHFREHFAKDDPPLPTIDADEEAYLFTSLQEPPTPQPSDPQQT